MVDSSGMETLLWAGAMYERTKREEGRRSVIGENYSARWKDIFETHAGPVDRTCVGRKWDRAAFDSPAEPVKKLFFFAFDNHGITSNAKRLNQRPARIQFIC